jgi:hypothetical protein
MFALGSVAACRHPISSTSAFGGKPASPQNCFEVSNLNVCFTRKQSFRSEEIQENKGRETATSGRYPSFET